MSKQATQKSAPGVPTYTIKVPLDRDRKEVATFVIKEIDKATYKAAAAIWRDPDKDMEAAEFLFRQLYVEGDDPSIIENNFVAIKALHSFFLDFITPLEVEVKKN